MTNIEPLRRPPTHPDRERRAALADAALGVDAFAPLEWLAGSGVHAADVLAAWADGKLIDVPVGGAFDVVRMPRTPGWDTVRHLRTMGATVGPILHTPVGVEALVPLGSADGWDLPDAYVLDVGDCVGFPHPAVVAPYTRNGCSWVAAPRDAVAPQTEPPLTDGADLYGAYAAALVHLGQPVEAA